MTEAKELDALSQKKQKMASKIKAGLLSYEMIPENIIYSITDYVVYANRPSGFIEAILSNNLFEVMSIADKDMQEILPSIVKFIYNNTPSGCWGSRKIVENWEGTKVTNMRKIEELRSKEKTIASQIKEAELEIEEAQEVLRILLFEALENGSH